MKMVDLKWSNGSSTAVHYSDSTKYITSYSSPYEKYTINGNHRYIITGDDLVEVFDYGYSVVTKKLAKVDRIIFNPPATIVIWKDGHKEVVKCSDDEIFEPEVGIAMCFMKRIFGSRHQFTKLSDKAWYEYTNGYLKKLRLRKKCND